MDASKFAPEKLLEPVELSEFARDYWDRRPLYVPGSPDKFEGLFSRRQWSELCEARAQRRELGTTVYTERGDDGKPVQGDVTPDLAVELSERATVCSMRVERECGAIAELIRAFKSRLGIADKMVVNCYVSPDGHGYPLHYDAQDVVVLQIEGSKRWRYSSMPAIYSPPEYPVPDGDARVLSPTLGRRLEVPDESDLEERVLTAGSLLYLPGGTWHVAQAVGTSLALTVTCVPRYLGRLLTEAVWRVLRKSDLWRRRLPVSADRGDSAAAGDSLAREVELFRCAIAGLDERDLFLQVEELMRSELGGVRNA